ncbi:YgdI/YgdR family lipoprotein [Shinella sp. H4-D48]|jgi:outer membrane lipoprotein SlyB|uniref:YgdI/YgdR family lipoprotein n=1 Tax=Shinella sedimenti TaxID=2919913 RepID=A0ABT0CPJ0_9HYPH|nr:MULTISPECIES: YgdI/YgdR family lipoprotein [Shinella]MCJ8150510.1 YgdI/YgdR family lipoprotein [Shinella sedimenti]UNK38737.1 YgdI/YgdR family lipoprotein [Shinella sp. H4-D48]
MRPIIGVIAAAFAVLSLAGCSTTSSADNTTYARPPVSDGGMRVPLN